jgi:hypothetical protein
MKTATRVSKRDAVAALRTWRAYCSGRADEADGVEETHWRTQARAVTVWIARLKEGQ